MANKTIDQYASELQERYDALLKRIAIIDSALIKIRDEIRKLMPGLPLEEANKLATFNIDLQMQREILRQHLRDFEDEIRQKQNKPLIIKLEDDNET